MQISRKNTQEEFVQVAQSSTSDQEITRILTGSLWMIGITLALFFLPALNGFIGGLVGGYKLGTIRRALIAAFLPMCVVTVSFWVISVVFKFPVVGFVAGITLGVLIALADVGIFLGAILGGAVSKRR